MFLNITLIEWVGYIASAVVALALTMSSLVRLRILSLIGSSAFAFYGFSIGAMPVGILNLFIAIVNSYYLIRFFSRKDSFKTLIVRPENRYLKYFIEFYLTEIKKFFPDFDKEIYCTTNESGEPFSFFILRNAAVAGVVLGYKKEEKVWICLDFVIPEYRDMKPGDYLYRKNKHFFLEQGITAICCRVKNEKHIKYLKRMGFFEKESNGNDKLMIKNLK